MKVRVCSAFVLRDTGIWEQPSFRILASATDAQIESCLMRLYDGFIVYGIQDDTDAPEGCIRDLRNEPEFKHKRLKENKR